MTYEEAISELVVIKSVYSHMRGEYKPCVEALQMAIDLLRQADTPQTTSTPYCVDTSSVCKVDTPQTDCDTCKNGSLTWDSAVCDSCSKAHSNYEPQTDCGWK